VPTLQTFFHFFSNILQNHKTLQTIKRALSCGLQKFEQDRTEIFFGKGILNYRDIGERIFIYYIYFWL